MARKLDPEKREKILQSALKLFVANGVPHTSTAAIAQEAGIAAGTLFLYFPTKQTLIHELTLHISREQAAYVRERLSSTLGARARFFAIWESSLRWFLENPTAFHYIQQIRESGLLDEIVVAETARSLSYYYEAIQQGLAEGCLKAYPPELLGEILYQDIVAVTRLIHAQPDAAQREAYLQRGFEIFWHGIKEA